MSRLIPDRRFISLSPDVIEAVDGSWHIAGLLQEIHWREVENGTPGIRASRETWAERLVLSPDQVGRLVRRAIEMGVIKNLVRGADRTMVLTVDHAALEARMDRDHSAKSPQPNSAKSPDVDPANLPDVLHTEELLEELPTPLPTESGAGRSAEFAVFYAAYPRKKSPDAAERAWASALRKGATPEQIMAGLQRSVAVWASEGRTKEKLPYPASWLNAGGYKDGDDDWVAPTTPTARQGDKTDRLMTEARRLGERQAPASSFATSLGLGRQPSIETTATENP